MQMDASAALSRLKAGNSRFADNQLTLDISEAARMDLIEGQSPFAAVLGCSDSRVPTEVIFDQGLGDLFVIRVAGNVVAPSQIGSIEFAAIKFGISLVVVLGHTHCGAIAETIDELRRPEKEQSKNIAAIVNRIRPSIDGLLNSGDVCSRDELMRRAVRENVRYATEELQHGSSIIEGLVGNAQLTIVGAEYSLETGHVDFFDSAIENRHKR